MKYYYSFAKHLNYLVRFILRESGRCSITLNVTFLEESVGLLPTPMPQESCSIE